MPSRRPQRARLAAIACSARHTGDAADPETPASVRVERRSETTLSPGLQRPSTAPPSTQETRARHSAYRHQALPRSASRTTAEMGAIRRRCCCKRTARARRSSPMQSIVASRRYSPRTALTSAYANGTPKPVTKSYPGFALYPGENGADEGTGVGPVSIGACALSPYTTS
jgi:hypothetical protein